MSRFELIIFDFDGTLADTARVICGGFAGAVRGTAAERSADEFREHLGQPLDRVYGAMCREVDGYVQPFDEFVERYIIAYERLSDTETSLFPGVERFLTPCSSMLAIASAKPTATLRKHAEQVQIAHHFDAIQGTDDFPHKPDPTIIRRIWERIPTAVERTVFVGDTDTDMEAGRRAGVTTIGITHGAHDRMRLEAAGADVVIDAFDALGALIG